MKHVILWELSRRRWFTIWWTIGVSALVSLTILSYLALENQTQQLEQALGDMSATAGAFVGGQDLFSPAGYLSSQIYYIMLPIMIIIMTITLASSLLKRDENDTTVELSLARPIGRLPLLASKALAGLIITFIVGVMSYLVATISVYIADIDIDHPYLALTHFLAFAFALSFGVIAFILMAASRQTRGLAGTAAVVLAFGSYLISSLSGFVDFLEPVAKALPFHYYDTLGMLKGDVEPGLIAYLLAIAIFGIAASIIGYSRRDIG